MHIGCDSASHRALTFLSWWRSPSYVLTYIHLAFALYLNWSLVDRHLLSSLHLGVTYHTTLRLFLDANATSAISRKWSNLLCLCQTRFLLKPPQNLFSRGKKPLPKLCPGSMLWIHCFVRFYASATESVFGFKNQPLISINFVFIVCEKRKSMWLSTGNCAMFNCYKYFFFVVLGLFYYNKGDKPV